MIIQRHFFLGDNWIYLKIYTGFKTADLLLKEVIYPLSQYFYQHQFISHWFFIRYNDPDFHLRVRFYILETNNINEIIQQIHKLLQGYFTNSLIWKIQYDTYNREIERYGENTIDLSEQIFCADSEMIINLLINLQGNEPEKRRWLFALRAIDELLTIFNYSIEKKLELLISLKDNFDKEFQIEVNLKKQFSLGFRENRREIEKILKVNKEEQPLLLPIFQKSEKIKRIADQILEYERDKTSQVPINELLCSHIHMMINRLFRTQQRKHELILYDFMFRYYDSEIAKEKFSKKENQ